MDAQNLKITNVAAPTAASQDAANASYVDTGDTNAKARANHTGTQLAATISDFNTAVRTNSLDQMTVPAADVSWNTKKITTLAAGTAGSNDAARMVDIDNAIAGIAGGLVLKGSVRGAVNVNVNLAAPGATVDGLTMASGEILWLQNQTTNTQNGPYVWNGAASAMTRATNFDTTAKAILGSFWIVRENTTSQASGADKILVLTNDTAITLGTTVLTTALIGLGGGSYSTFVQNSPAISAGGVGTITHNLNTTDVFVVVKRVGSPFDAVDVYWATPTVNTVTIEPDIAYASGEYRIMVVKVA
jgi:hypothetical protein